MGQLSRSYEHEQQICTRCDFADIDCVNRAVKGAYRADVVPVLILRYRGRDLGRFVNTLDAEQVREAIAQSVA